MSNVPVSPITGTRDVQLVMSVPCTELREVYQANYRLDITRFLPQGLQHVSLYRCVESGLRFWDPGTIVGDDGFYATLSRQSWYYMPDKWEFAAACSHLPRGGALSVLEIGSARGDFLARVQREVPGCRAIGLELNSQAAAAARARGLVVHTELSGSHVQSHQGVYDAIASFQVLEHVPDPMSLLRDAVAMLKPGGMLILAVPDNSLRAAPSIFIRPDADLNMPPHHQTLWDTVSLAYLAKVLPLRLESLVVEPAIARHHSTGYRGLMKFDLMRRYGRVLGFAVYAAGRPFYDHALRHLDPHLPGHTVLAVYRKQGA
jgi:SAM-dependent methyltransferase